MDKLSDLEICNRIAEIKDLAPLVVADELITGMGSFDLFDLSPTNKANKLAKFVFNLMFEFEVCVCHYESIVFIQSDYTDRPNKSRISFCDGNEYSFRRSILLCIIEAHKENNNE